ncbi:MULTISPECIES: YqaA family protein [Bacillaceae]|uniref:Membrane protein n=2 Tax=Bacillus infantis TaxID=324767 RepID=U5L4T9_9BACI|nr:MULTISPECIES: YqaA family protein [Bacillus]OXT15759.1 DedA family protein [Bacillus sp. OG2]AGX02233.1 membrane protein [Bacillus infantis NRRL B-14911]EAR64945.1 DedA [Bacillus sp. NRRL B-14911]MCA1037419.1 DedA family protein [Bacillus infantis]MCK6208267.1 DedA family protein [Bacillus infantis]
MSELIHSIEEWLMEYGIFGLFFVSFADSSFFPIPPDVLLIPMGISNPDRVIWYAFITTVASVLGAILGWFIGKKLGRPVLRYIISEERIQKVENYFNKYGPVAILIAGFTPIPYKVFTIFAGITKVQLRTLIIWSIIGRGARFFLEAALIMVLGAQARPFIEENFGMLTLIGGALIVIVYIIYLIMRKKKKTV